MADKSTNRRQHTRHDVELTASVQDMDNTLSAAVLNVSNGGVFLCCEDPPPCWQNVVLTIELPEKERTIKAKGVVVWRISAKEAKRQPGIPAGAGIQFLDIDKADLAILEALIQKQTGSHDET